MKCTKLTFSLDAFTICQVGLVTILTNWRQLVKFKLKHLLLIWDPTPYLKNLKGLR